MHCTDTVVHPSAWSLITKGFSKCCYVWGLSLVPDKINNRECQNVNHRKSHPLMYSPSILHSSRGAMQHQKIDKYIYFLKLITINYHQL